MIAIVCASLGLGAIVGAGITGVYFSAKLDDARDELHEAKMQQARLLGSALRVSASSITPQTPQGRPPELPRAVARKGGAL